jgi:hypothetical protein
MRKTIPLWIITDPETGAAAGECRISAHGTWRPRWLRRRHAAPPEMWLEKRIPDWLANVIWSVNDYPWQDLDPETLDNLIESFVLREGTDYGEHERSLNKSRR